MENNTWHDKHKVSMSFGDRIADAVANGMGSWRFIIWQTIIVIFWMILNIIGFVSHWDVYPFILLNLIFSTQAAYAAPIIMMSQNRQNKRDRVQAQHDYKTNIDARRKEPIHPDFTIQKVSCQNYQFSALCFDSYTATWDFGDSSVNQTGNTMTHNYTKPGEFVITLTLSSATKTYGSVTKRITILPQSIEITGPDSVCNNSNFATQYFTQVIPNAKYKWTTSYANISGQDDLPYVGVTWPQPASFNGEIQLVVSTADGCFLNATKNIVVKQGPAFNWILQDSICNTDQPFILNATPSGGIFSGWGVSNGIFSPDSAGVGFHILTYRYGIGSICYSEIQKTIQVIDSCAVFVPPVSGGASGIAIPNVFSPNGDGINDSWRIKYLDNFPNAIVDVYNRYGQLVFHSIGYSKNWDGKYNGKDVPVGTYYYLIVTAPSTEPLSGSISILR